MHLLFISISIMIVAVVLSLVAQRVLINEKLFDFLRGSALFLGVVAMIIAFTVMLMSYFEQHLVIVEIAFATMAIELYFTVVAERRKF